MSTSAVKSWCFISCFAFVFITVKNFEFLISFPVPLVKYFVYIVSALSSTVTLDHFWNCMLNSIRIVKSSGGSRGGAPLIFRPNWDPMGRKEFFRRPPPPPPLPYLRVWMTGLPPYLKVLSGTEVYKNAKTHNVYHCSLCFIFDQTTMGQEQKSLWDSLSPRFFSEGRGRLYTGYSAQQWLQKGSVIWTGGIGSWQPQRENRQYNII